MWHDFAWTRDVDGWWSLSIDGQEVWHNFCQDNRLTSFDPIGIHVLRNQSEIEWVRISVSEPPCVVDIEDSDIHEWIYCEPVSCSFGGTLTDPANAFDGDWNTYAEVRSNGNGTCSICCGLQETWSVPIGADLEFHYRIEGVDVYQQAILSTSRVSGRFNSAASAFAELGRLAAFTKPPQSETTKAVDTTRRTVFRKFLLSKPNILITVFLKNHQKLLNS